MNEAKSEKIAILHKIGRIAKSVDGKSKICKANPP